MRKITLFFSLLVFAVVAQAQVVFDPNTYKVGKFQNNDKLEIVAIGNAKYLKATLAGWDLSFQVSATTLDAASDKFVTEAKYEKGTSAFEATQTQTFIKMYGGPEVGTIAQTSTVAFTEIKGTVKLASGKVENIQVAAMETTGWKAVTGGVIYVGIIKAVKSTTGINESTAKQLEVYPNPASDMLHIANLNEVEQVQIISASGSVVKTVYNVSNDGIDINGLNTGVYILRAISKNTVYQSRFVKN